MAKTKMISLSEIKINPKNPRIIKDGRFKKLKKSVSKFKKMLELRPIIIDEDNVILGGNKRYEALVASGVTEVPGSWVKKASDLTAKEKQEFIIKDNVPFGEWEIDALRDEFDIGELEEWGLDDIDFTVGGAGGKTDEDSVPDIPREPITKLGDFYQLGDHRLLCGDSTNLKDVERLMAGEKADMVFTDPPYGISYSSSKFDGNTKGVTNKRNKANMIIGDGKEFDPSFILKIFASVKEIFIWGMQYYPQKLGRGGVVCWNKKKESEAQCPHGDFELCWSKAERNKMFWYRWGGFNNKEKGESRLHTTQKPVDLAIWFFDNWGRAKNIIVDLFGGSGSTLIACEKTGRKCRMMELDGIYCDVIVKRWEEYTGQKAQIVKG